MLMNNKKILLGGCSYTENALWPSVIFDNCDIVNFGKSGAGNTYISNTITSNIDPENPPDYVFVLWSGINRIDIRFPNHFAIEDAITRSSVPMSGTTDSSCWLFSGGKHMILLLIESYNNIKDASWPEISSIDDFYSLPSWIKDECLGCDIFDFIDSPNLLKEISLGGLQSNFLMQYLDDNIKYYSELTFQSMVNCFTLLNQYNIDYKFSFIYDIFSNHANNETSLGKIITKDSYYYHHIDWGKYIKCTPYEYGLKHDLMEDDEFHLTADGMKQWAEEVKCLIKE